MSDLHAGVAGFDITPEIHPKYGAWGTTPSLTSVDMPLLARCIVLEHDRERLVWFGSDLCGNPVHEVATFRDEIAEALSLERRQIVWSTSQTHSSATVPGSNAPGGSSTTTRGKFDVEYCDAQRQKWIDSYKEAAREAIDGLQPADVHVGKGYCDSMSYNTRFPMPTGGVKFSRSHAEGLQSGKYFDPTIGLLRFDDKQGKPLGGIFNFCCHPATMIDDTMISPDWVGTAREIVEEAIGGAPAMFVQGFCGDVNCRHLFGAPEQARRNGEKLGRAAAAAMPHLVPARAVPLRTAWKTVELACRPMYSREELEESIAGRLEFIEALDHDPAASWFCGINLPEQFSVENKIKSAEMQIDCLREGLRLLDAGEPARSSLDLPLGGIRIGDVVAAISPGENFTQTGRQVRERSPFAHTLVCGDTNGMFGYIGDDAEIDRGGYETESFWMVMYNDGFRLAPAKGTVGRVLRGFDEVFHGLTQPGDAQA
jgi:hypothetical protein